MRETDALRSRSWLLPLLGLICQMSQPFPLGRIYIRERAHRAWAFPGVLDGKEFSCNPGDPHSIPGSGRSPREGTGNPLQYSCLGNPMDRGARWATVYRVTESDMPEQISTYTEPSLAAGNCQALGKCVFHFFFLAILTHSSSLFYRQPPGQVLGTRKCHEMGSAWPDHMLGCGMGAIQCLCRL